MTYASGVSVSAPYCADRLDLLEGDTLPPYSGPGPCGRTTGIVRRRIAALDAEIDRLTRLRERLAARIAAPH